MPPHLPTPNLEKLKEAAALGDKWADGSWATTSDADLSVKALHSEQVRFRRRRQSEEAVLMRSWRWGAGGVRCDAGGGDAGPDFDRQAGGALQLPC